MAKITDIMLFQDPRQYALVIECRGSMATFGKLIGEGFRKIGTYLEELGEFPSDIPCVEYPAYNEMSEEDIRMVITFYTAKPLPAQEDIRSITFPERKVAACLHKGSYDELAGLYNEMAGWIKEKGFEGTGSSMEHYYTGPDTPEPEQVTRVVMPLK